MLPTPFLPFRVSNDFQLPSSTLMIAPPLQGLPEKGRTSVDSNGLIETEKSDVSALHRISMSTGNQEQNPPTNNGQAPVCRIAKKKDDAEDAISWASRLCHTSFFNPCAKHSSKVYRRCECTYFCMDCPDSGALCSSCLSDHNNCRTLQIRRYVYRDVVKVGDIQQYIDTSGIQTYTVNHAQAIFLSAKDKAVVGPYYRVDSSSSCVTCHRGLRNGCFYCSLACKLAAEAGVKPPEPSKEQRSKTTKVQRSKSKCTNCEEDSAMATEEFFNASIAAVERVLAPSLPPSGAITPSDAPESGMTSMSTDCPLSCAISQVLERSRKRTVSGLAPIATNLKAVPHRKNRRKQERPMRAVE